MDGPIPEADVTNRIKLLTILKETLQDAVPPTVWACLWLSDMEKLEELVDQVQLQPCPWLAYFSSIESNAKKVQICTFIDFYVFLQCGSANTI